MGVITKTMKRAMCCFAIGTHEELLNIGYPTFEAFADRHGWDLHRMAVDPAWETRPASWYKVPIILGLLERYDEVFFLGADTIIVDGTYDLKVRNSYWQALVRHHTPFDGEVPNADVWLCRKVMIPILEQMWEKTHLIDHCWWEQAALLELMGYTLTRPCHVIEPTELYNMTYFLNSDWNVHCNNMSQSLRPIVQHATMYHDRAQAMRQWAKQAEEWI